MTTSLKTHSDRLEFACNVLTKMTGDKFNLECVKGSKFSIHRGGCGYIGRKSKKGAWKPTAVRLSWDEASTILWNILDIHKEDFSSHSDHFAKELEQIGEAMDVLCD